MLWMTGNIGHSTARRLRWVTERVKDETLTIIDTMRPLSGRAPYEPLIQWRSGDSSRRQDKGRRTSLSLSDLFTALILLVQWTRRGIHVFRYAGCRRLSRQFHELLQDFVRRLKSSCEILGMSVMCLISLSEYVTDEWIK